MPVVFGHEPTLRSSQLVNAYDYAALIPVLIDNVHPPLVARDVHREGRTILDRICEAYTARWHL